MRVPEHIAESLERYVQHGIPPGDCLRAILANDLETSFMRADPITTACMRDIVVYLGETVPREIRGSYEAVDGWQSTCLARRRSGLDAARTERAQ